MKSFITRVVSALIAFGGVLFLYFYFAEAGFKFLVSLAVVLGSIELIKILFNPRDPLHLKNLFYVLCLAVFGVSSVFPAYAGLALGLAFVLLAAVTVLLHAQFENINEVRNFTAKGILGFIYIALLPSFAWRTLELPHGMWWFWVLISVVFGGDIGAYAFGVLWGKTKLMPKLSPKKSLQGSLGGLVGSIIAILVCHFLHPYVSWQPLIILALAMGMMAQLGDFFESLLKRIADVKDSGAIMPGHGGILDRIDGVLFACPVVYLGALILEKIF